MTSEERLTTAAWTKRIRIVLGISILIISVALLIWGLFPPRREIRTQPISPTELQLPTPEASLPSGRLDPAF